ncbi:hypothetical protein [Xylanibacter muris]|nr:hypothetical protein [Xylanibacter muris]
MTESDSMGQNDSKDIIFDISGRIVSQIKKKGIYIRNGKKIAVK